MQTFENYRTVTLDKQQVLSQIGYDGDNEPSLRISSLVEDYVENYHNLIDFSYSYIIKDVKKVKGKKVEIEGGITLESGVISKLLSNCREVAFFILTIGNYLEEMVAHLAENGMVLQATVLDAIGSGTAEQMAELVENKIKETAAIKGMFASRRFSPGYCDWDISQQEMVFRAIEDDADVTLTDQYLMIPRKSVSGIIGIGKDRKVITGYNPCRTCRNTDCPGRRI